MSDPVRVIRKYPNRRLYDTQTSAYITLEGVRRLVLDGVPFQVVDSRSKEDITRAILLQIISTMETRGSPVFSTELLQQIIRFYGDALQGLLGAFLQNSLTTFTQQQGRFRSSSDPVALMAEMTEKNLALWSAWIPRTTAAKKSDPKPADPPEEKE